MVFCLLVLASRAYRALPASRAYRALPASRAYRALPASRAYRALPASRAYRALSASRALRSSRPRGRPTGGTWRLRTSVGFSFSETVLVLVLVLPVRDRRCIADQREARGRDVSCPLSPFADAE
jgi:hypothetical protein